MEALMLGVAAVIAAWFVAGELILIYALYCHLRDGRKVTLADIVMVLFVGWIPAPVFAAGAIEIRLPKRWTRVPDNK